MVTARAREESEGEVFRTPLAVLEEKTGVVYTKAWVVDAILDLAGYTCDRDLAAAVAVEPSAGDGAFIVPMVQRLMESCVRHQRPVASCADALLVYEIDEGRATALRTTITRALVRLGITHDGADTLAGGWVRVRDYLLGAPTLPAADYVIGNPPYNRLEDMDATTMATYRAMYPTMKGRADIYIAFYEAALRQLKPAGVCAFICADRWMLNQYGQELRRLVTAAYSVEAVIEMHNAAPFEHDVDAYPAITVIRRSPQGPVVVARAGASTSAGGASALVSTIEDVRCHGDGITTQAGVRAARSTMWFSDGDPWPCVSPDRLALLKRLERDFAPLESPQTGTRVGIGVATGADAVFITTNRTLVEESRSLPLAMAADTFTGHLEWSGHYLVDPWTADGLVDLAAFPRLAAYYNTHRSVLENRNVGKRVPHAWYRTIDRVNHALTAVPKLY